MTARGPGGVLPLVIRLGGHRDLRPQDVPQLEARVAEVGALSPRLRDLDRCYAAAYALSIHFQRRTRRFGGV